MITHYEILKVQKSASLIVINAAYEALRQKYHPDNYPDDEVKRTKAERVINRLNLAYSVLSDPIKRRDYDNSLNPPTVEVIDPQQITQNATATSETFANQRRITNIQAGFSAIIIGVFVLLFIIFPKAINNFTTPPSIEIDPENFKKYKIEHCEISSNLNQDFKCVLTNKDNKRLAKNYFVAEIYDKSGVRISNSSSFPDSDVMPEESQKVTLFTHYPASDIAKINLIHIYPREDMLFSKAEVEKLKIVAMSKVDSVYDSTLKEMKADKEYGLRPKSGIKLFMLSIGKAKIVDYELGTVTWSNHEHNKFNYAKPQLAIIVQYRYDSSSILLRTPNCISEYPYELAIVYCKEEPLTTTIQELGVFVIDGVSCAYSDNFDHLNFNAAKNVPRFRQQYSGEECDFQPLTQHQLDNIY